MKFYSKGGKFSSAPQSTQKKREEPVRHSKVAPVPTRSAVSEDRSVARKAKTQARRNRNILIGAALIFFAIMAATLIFLLVRKAKVTNDYRKLAQQVQQAEESHAATAPSVEMTQPPKGDVPGTVPETPSVQPQETEPVEPTILPKYQALAEENPEFFGWLRLDDTVLDYPVMRSFEDNDEYLYGNFEGDYCYTGVPFADYRCDRDSDNILIYGHNIRDGSMFRPLFKYEDEDYWRENPTIMFSDLYGDYEYEILSVFRDRVYYKYETVFKFYQFMDTENEEEFDYSVDQLKAKSIYDTGVDAEYGDHLITLITCAYHEENGRFVVVARRKG